MYQISVKWRISKNAKFLSDYLSQTLCIKWETEGPVIFLSSLVRVCVIDHQPGPLGHLSEVSEGVVEVLDGRDVGVGLQVEGELKARLVSEDAGEDGDVAPLVEDLQLITSQTESYSALSVISSLV